MSRTEVCDVLVVGAGFAGASTAFFLARELGGRRVVVIDRESHAGVHSSGRNASLVRGPCGDPRQDPLSIEGADFLRNPPADFARDPAFRAVGSLFVDLEDRLAARCVPGSEAVPLTRVLEAAPAFDPEPGTAAVWTPGDGVVDKEAVLLGYLEGAVKRGVELGWGESLQSFSIEAGRVVGVATSRRRFSCGQVVLAAGAWAGLLGRQAGSSVSLRPTRRHLSLSAPLDEVDPDAPYVWDVPRGFYFRPAEGGLLLCACDQDEQEPGDCPSDPVVENALVETFARVLPAWSRTAIRRSWAGHRTFADRSEGLWEEDAEVGGLYWAAGLGGFGLTASAAIGRRVAESVGGGAR